MVLMQAFLPGLAGRAARKIRRVLAPRVGKRSANPYATHLPVSIGLSRLLPLQRVLELGCGHYSTLAFLDRQLFPDLIRLDSYENDPAWVEAIRALTQFDPRISLTTVTGSISSALAVMDFALYDLIFIDDSTNAADRSQTIRAVRAHCQPHNVIVIHDYEVEDYQEAARSFPQTFRFTPLNPNTGLAWDKAPLRRADLRRINRVLKRYGNLIPPDDGERWLQVFRQDARL
jgi:CheY-like chemotaxis protein